MPARSRLKKFWKHLGPGIITGASDDDPSGIVTYAIAGAKGGFGFLWTALVTFPLMAAIQEMCARIGLVNSLGLAGVMRKRYSRPFLWTLMLLTSFAHTVNIGANLGGMGEALSLLLPVPPIVGGLIFTVLIVGMMVFLPYRRIAGMLKWLTFALFAYIIAAFFSRPDWGEVFHSLFRPEIAWNKETVTILIALLGTTISPYLFFWQASEEVEEREARAPFRVAHHIVTKHELKHMREDVTLGMLFSNVVMFFIMVSTGATLHAAGATELGSAGDVALALEPFAGSLSLVLFAVGIIGTGLLAIPVLAGSTAYLVAETFGFKEGLNKGWKDAKIFYGVIVFSTIMGFALNLLRINSMDALFASAVIFGIVSPPLILIILDIANNKAIMGNKTNTLFQNILGGITFLLMAAAALLYLMFLIAE